MAASEVDPRFRQMGRSARRRRRRVAAWRWSAAAVVLVLGGAVLWWQVQPDFSSLFQRAVPDDAMVQVESQFDIAPVVRADTFTDIPGDPLIIAAPDEGAKSDIAQTVVPAGLVGNPRLGGTTLSVLKTSLMPRGLQLVANLPSTREEFAMFQSERSRGRLRAETATPIGTLSIDKDQRATSSVTFLRDAKLRTGLWRELILETVRDVTVADLLVQNGFDQSRAEALAQRIEGQLSIEKPLPAGSLLALRYRMRGDQREVIQLSLYGPGESAGGYQGSLALSSAGQLVPSADPWVDQPIWEELIARQNGEERAAGQQRLLDMIYSVGLRNDLSSELIGEAIAMMARVYDLDSLAHEDDRLTLILADGSQAAQGAILFIAINGPGGEKACYVVPAAEGEGFECYAPSARVARTTGGLQLTMPVAGVLSQRFVPPARDGEDDVKRGRIAWSAPTGTAVTAAGAGRITARNAKGENGASIEITHEGGMVSRYSGLGSLSQAGASGDRVTAGTVIGTVGAGKGGADSGLVFQLLSDDTPVDPMPYLSGVGEVLASDAVEALIGRIITVESAGNARARNPLSTATGLGQFIESTWLRMLRSYRPELTASLSRQAQLELRFDPDLSRQMVRHLAQENEAFLRARGHEITAGRLYLAHFLGPAGADQALRADPSAPVVNVMGAAVVGANPFLRGYSIADLRSWADRKMNSAHATGAQIPVEVAVPVEIRAYVEEVDRLRHSQGG